MTHLTTSGVHPGIGDHLHDDVAVHEAVLLVHVGVKQTVQVLLGLLALPDRLQHFLQHSTRTYIRTNAARQERRQHVSEQLAR